MKIINEKGKLFGLINIVDLIVLLLVVAVIGVVGTKLMGSKVTDAVSAKADCWAQVRVAGAQPYLVEEVMRQELPGQRMVSGNEFLSGTVEVGDKDVFSPFQGEGYDLVNGIAGGSPLVNHHRAPLLRTSEGSVSEPDLPLLRRVLSRGPGGLVVDFHECESPRNDINVG